jgi:hypothetical protein
MTVSVDTTRYTFWKDHHRYFVRVADTTSIDPLWDADGATGDFVFPPTDGVLRWRLPFCLEVIPGKEAGEIDVDVAWLDGPPAGVEMSDGVASACDIATPTGRVAIADSYDDVLASHDFGSARTCRVFVEVVDRDRSGEAGVMWGAKTSEHHTILIWPTNAAAERWASAHRDRTAAQHLASYRDFDIDPDVGQRGP